MAAVLDLPASPARRFCEDFFASRLALLGLVLLLAMVGVALLAPLLAP